MSTNTLNGIEIHLKTLKNSDSLSLSSMNIDKLKHLNSVITKLIESNNVEDLKVSIEEGCWKIILFSTLFSMSNANETVKANFNSFASYINRTFESKKVISFTSVDGVNHLDSIDITNQFSDIKSIRVNSIDKIVSYKGSVISKHFTAGNDIFLMFNSSLKRFILNNGLSKYYQEFKLSELNSNLLNPDSVICVVDNSSKYSGVVGIFSDQISFDKYFSIYENIYDKYSELKELESNSANKIVSNDILDFFDSEYANILRNKNNTSNDNIRDLHSFISLFLNRNFDKQIHFNILANMAFIKDSVLTSEIKKVIRNLYFKKY